MVEVSSADVMAILLKLKAEAEERLGTRMRMVFSGATEAHILAEEIGMLITYAKNSVIHVSAGKAGVGVILNPSRPYPATWDQRRM